QLDAVARARTLFVVRHVTARLVAAGIAGDDDADVRRIDENPHRPLRIVRRDVIRRDITVGDKLAEIELEAAGLARKALHEFGVYRRLLPQKAAHIVLRAFGRDGFGDARS